MTTDSRTRAGRLVAALVAGAMLAAGATAAHANDAPADPHPQPSGRCGGGPAPGAARGWSPLGKGSEFPTFSGDRASDGVGSLPLFKRKRPGLTPSPPS